MTPVPEQLRVWADITVVLAKQMHNATDGRATYGEALLAAAHIVAGEIQARSTP